MTNIPYYFITKKSCLKKRKPPLLIMLHGYGSNEKDLFSFSDALPEQYTIVSLRAPINIGMGFAWYDISFDQEGKKIYDREMAIKTKNSLINCINILNKELQTDPFSVTLMGFSQGAILSNAIALTNPSGIKNVICLSGGVDKEIIELSKKNLKSLSFYFSHGVNDSILPFNQAKNSLEFLKNNNVNFDFESYPIGHGVSPENFKSMLRWLIKHS
ncbi:MAG: phospholipase [Flavobacteriaceae bacterium]|nr:phospholipase [Flavobacteriaceae bacterium]|tara:strand:- start:888 stop:1532 length:645 start_codon:yes stop_codon:yes gene_type:complete